MLNQLRSLSKTWIAGLLFALLIASFAMWGVSDLFTSHSPNAVAVVGKDEITLSEYSASFERELESLNQRANGQIDRNTAIQLGFDQAILQRLVLQSEIEQKARALGLTATDAAVAREIRSIAAFRDPITGEFDRDTYLSLLAQNNMAPALFESETKLDLIQGQLSAVLSAGFRPPDSLAAVQVRFARETRSLSVVSIPPTAAGDVPEPTDEELTDFYEPRKSAYAAPPRRAFSFVTLAVSDFLADAPVDEDAVRETYEQRADTLGKPETRNIVEISAPDRDAAAEVARRLRAGDDAADIADDLGLAAPNTYDDAVPDDLLTSALADAAFAVEDGEVTDPIDGGIAWFVAKVNAITPAQQQTFEEARPEIELELAQDEAGEKLFDAVDAFEAARDQGAGLEDAAKAAGVPAFVYGLTTSNGVVGDAEAAQAPVLVAHPEILQAAYAAQTTGAMSDLTPLGEDGYFVVRADAIVPAAERPLAEVEEQVRAQYALAKQSEALDAVAETVRAALTDGASPSEAAAAASPDASGEVSELRRDQTTPTLPRDVLGQVFASPKGEIVVAGAPSGGRVAVRVDDIVMSEDLPDDDLEQARAQLTDEVLGDLSQLFQQALQGEFEPSVDQQLLARAAGVDLSQ